MSIITEMPKITQDAKIDVKASAPDAFDVVTGDVMRREDDPELMTGQVPLEDGPLREGFRWRQTIVHERKQCRSDWVVTEVQPGRVLAQTMLHFCAVSQREIRGGERWEFAERDDETTLVTLRSWRLSPGLDGWLAKVLGLGMERPANLELRRRLAVVQFKAERHASNSADTSGPG